MQDLKLIKIPFRRYQIIIAQEDSETEEFTVTLQKASETTFGNTRIEQVNGNSGSDLVDIMNKMSVLIDVAEHE